MVLGTATDTDGSVSVMGATWIVSVAEIYWMTILAYEEDHGRMIALRGGADGPWFWGLDQIMAGVYL